MFDLSNLSDVSGAPDIHNILPYDGITNYYGPILTEAVAQQYFDQLWSTIAWAHDELLIYGRRITTKRKVAWYGDLQFAYSYSKSTKVALPWTEALAELKTLVERWSGETYNTCLLNLYHSGEEGMGWHSDNEPELLESGAIASLSLGAARKFVFKHRRTQQKVEQMLESSSLLVMKGATQQHWLHSLPPTKKVQSPRINLTFRTIVESPVCAS